MKVSEVIFNNPSKQHFIDAFGIEENKFEDTSYDIKFISPLTPSGAGKSHFADSMQGEVLTIAPQSDRNGMANREYWISVANDIKTKNDLIVVGELKQNCILIDILRECNRKIKGYILVNSIDRILQQRQKRNRNILDNFVSKRQIIFESNKLETKSINSIFSSLELIYNE